MIRLTKTQAADFGKIRYITPWFAIEPLEIKDGSFILPEDLIDYLTEFEKNPKIKEACSANNTLKALPIRKLNKDELKENILDISPMER